MRCSLGAFEDQEIIHVDDTVDPVRDLEIISEELRLKDIEFMERKLEDLEKTMKRSNDKQLKIEHECCQKVKSWLEAGKDVRLGEWKAADVEILNTFQLLTAKAVVYLVSSFIIAKEDFTIIEEELSKYLVFNYCASHVLHLDITLSYSFLTM